MKIIGSILLFMVPSFLRRPSMSKHKGTPGPEPNAKHLALDGVRGIASFSIFYLHFSDLFFVPRHNFGYGSSKLENKFYQLPFVHYFVSGNGNVTLFFVLSGLVLSKKPIRLIREQQHGKLAQGLASMVFRRAFRLFVPTTVVMFIAFVLLRMGAYEPGRHNVETRHDLTTATDASPPLLPTFWAQLQDFINVCIVMTEAWGGGGGFMPSYNPHLWTIRAEYAGSMILAVVVMGIACLKTWARIVVLCTVLWSGLHAGFHGQAMFIAGILINEFQEIVDIYKKNRFNSSSLTQRPGSPQSTNNQTVSIQRILGPKQSHRYTAIAQRIALFLPFVLGWYLIGTPDARAEATPGFRTLIYFIPSAGDLQRIGAVMLILSVLNSPDAEWLYTRPFVVYLGKISYSLYCIHGLVKRVVIYAAIPRVFEFVGGNQTGFTFACGFILLGCVYAPLCFCIADMFWRGVDVPSVKIARWVEAKLIMEKK